MTDYISREAALERIREYIEEYGEPEENGLHNLKWCAMIEAEMVLTDIPAADVREVVYCKDCRHRDPEDHKCDCGGTERQGCPFKVADDYFCAYGER